MKTITKFALLLLIAVATGSSAWAQAQQLIGGKPYTFTGDTASGAGIITYQWFRNNEPIPGATNADYTLLDYLAHGINVTFKRGAVSSVCPGNVSYTNNVTVSFGLRVGSVNWASVNVAAYQTFASRPDMFTQYYQWNRPTAWAATGSNVNDWSSANITDASWLINPCPNGWRLPTQDEYQQLHNSGTTWADVNTRGNLVNGRFYGYNHSTCRLPSNMSGCVFFPACGYRSSVGATLFSVGERGDSWSSTQRSIAYGYSFSFNHASSNPAEYSNKAPGLSVRCVK